MSIYTQRTQQKLFYCQLQLQILQKIATYDELQQVALTYSCAEAALFHLQGAWRALLGEIAQAYRLDPHIATQAADLVELGVPREQVIPEALHLQSLTEDTFSWWRACQRRYEQALGLGLEQASTQNTPTAPLLLATDKQTSDALPLAADLHQEISTYLQAFKQLSENIRTGLSEY
ncbi:hypothetical protein SAMN05421831_105166 [Allopseudospirillum japonicum]|uniref:Uncharacterized protein n=1 Tax=Allopseudospirillum japonicum TaxID=64971 RepID=A0A1H6SEL1_9GAMM|nr:DUF6586 family protein [Allopseudospirillum japonicum]SEI61892.1 hypothetical protein SAMN05421831_105166 [Allopseudospirillum japonicum]